MTFAHVAHLARPLLLVSLSMAVIPPLAVAAQGTPSRGVTAPAVSAPDTSSPAVRRGIEVVQLLHRADVEETRRFIRDTYSPQLLATAGMYLHVNIMARAFPLARTYDGLTSRRVTKTSAGVVFREVDLDEWYAVVIEVEPTAPHRIVRVSAGLPARAPEGVARPAAFKTDREAWSALQRHLTTAERMDLFSGAVAIARGPKLVGAQGYGEASREFGVPNTASTRINLGSINKMFTAVAILQLVEQGRLGLEDPVAKYLPGVLPPEAENDVRIKHLLTHTSGLRDILFTPEMQLSNRSSYRYLADFLPLIKEKKLAFAPGTGWAYSNTGFIVLGAIVEKASNMPYDAYIAKHVFTPAGMTDSDPVELDRSPKGIAFGYMRVYDSGEKRWASDRYSQGVRGTPAGGGYSTVGDLVRFADALRTHRLLSPAMTQAMLSPKPELGSPFYGYGTELADPGVVGHSGGGPGTTADFRFNPTGDFTAVALANIETEASIVMKRVLATFPANGTEAARAVPGGGPVSIGAPPAPAPTSPKPPRI